MPITNNTNIGCFQKLCHVAWQRCYKWFLLPPWADHEHEWEVYDFTMAGCRLCGAQHVCGHGMCNESLIDHTGTEKVCVITGLCAPTLRTAETEFTDCNSINSTDATLLMSLKTNNDKDEEFLLFTQTIVKRTIMSSQTDKALKDEWERNVEKRVLSFIRVARNKKRENGTNLLDIFRYVMHETIASRRVIFLSHKDKERICTTCSRHIFCLLKTLHCEFGVSFLRRGEQKRQSIAVGLLYIMRTGITVRGVEILPSMPILKSILPHETLLQDFFRLRPKIITETENFIKAHLRIVSVHTLRKLSSSSF